MDGDELFTISDSEFSISGVVSRPLGLLHVGLVPLEEFSRETVARLTRGKKQRFELVVSRLHA